MNIKFQGFEFTLEGTGVSWEQVVAHLDSVSYREIMFRPFNRVLCLDSSANEDYILGLFVSIKDQKRFCEFRQAGGDFKLTSRDLEEGARMADFNFFVINKHTRKGIYQYYHQSCSLRQFLQFFEWQFFGFRKSLMDEYRADPSLDYSQREDLIDELRDTLLQGSLLVRPETFNQLLSQLDEIKLMRFSVSTADSQPTYFTPLKDVAKRRTERVLFKKDAVSKIRQGIRQITSDPSISDVKVTGTSAETGLETTIQLFSNLEDFGQYDYDELTEHLAVDLGEFTNSAILDLLLDAANEHSVLIIG